MIDGRTIVKDTKRRLLLDLVIRHRHHQKPHFSERYQLVRCAGRTLETADSVFSAHSTTEAVLPYLAEQVYLCEIDYFVTMPIEDCPQREQTEPLHLLERYSGRHGKLLAADGNLY